MATIDENTLGKVLDVLRPSLRSVELRGVAVEIEGKWELAAALLSATGASVENIRRKQEKLQAGFSLPEADRFEVVMDAAPIDDLYGILDAVNTGTLPFNGRTFNLSDLRLLPPKISLKDQTMKGGRSLSLPADSGLFPRYTISLRGALSPEDVLDQAGFEPSALGLSGWSDLNDFMGMAFFERERTTMRLGVAVSVYIAFDPIPTIREGAAHASLRVHKTLRDGLTVRGFVRQAGGFQTYPSHSHRIPLPPAANSEEIGRVSLEIPLDLGHLGTQDHVEFLWFHNNLGQVAPNNSASVYPAQFRAFNPDTLLIEALKHFDGGKHLREYLSLTKSAKRQTPLLPFEAGVLLTLSAINLRFVPLMVYRPAETIRDEGRGDKSADIIAVDQDLGLLVIDCTTEVPGPDKIQKLANTGQLLSSRLNVACRSVLVCSEDLTLIRRASVGSGVAFVQAAELQSIWDCALSGNTELALNHFRGLIGPPKANGHI